MKPSRLICLVLCACLVVLVGCASSGGDDYDPKNIAVKQPGNGPPPMNKPMGGGDSQEGK